MSPHLEQLEHIEAHVVVGEAGVKDLEVDVVHVFGDETGYLGAGITDDVEEGEDVGAACKVLENLDLALDLLLLDGLEYFDNTWFV